MRRCVQQSLVRVTRGGAQATYEYCRAACPQTRHAALATLLLRSCHLRLVTPCLRTDGNSLRLEEPSSSYSSFTTLQTNHMSPSGSSSSSYSYTFPFLGDFVAIVTVHCVVGIVEQLLLILWCFGTANESV